MERTWRFVSTLPESVASAVLLPKTRENATSEHRRIETLVWSLEKTPRAETICASADASETRHAFGGSTARGFNSSERTVDTTSGGVHRSAVAAAASAAPNARASLESFFGESPRAARSAAPTKRATLSFLPQVSGLARSKISTTRHTATRTDVSDES